MSGKYVDLTGNRFHRLVVLQRDGTHGSRAVWLCQCDCSNTTRVETADLRSGNTQSCGCIRREKCRERSVTHDKTNTRLFQIWRGMLWRCSPVNTHECRNYADRGIIVCEEWHEFNAFYEWAMSNGYDENAPRGSCTIDRINNDGNYCPTNCRWVDAKVQANNRRERTARGVVCHG